MTEKFTTQLTDHIVTLEIGKVTAIAESEADNIGLFVEVEGLDFIINPEILAYFGFYLAILTIREIAEIMNISVGTAHKLKQAIKAMNDGY